MLLRHLRQHVVRRTVDNPHDLRDAVGGKTFLERLDDGNTAADACLIEEINTVLICRSIQFAQMLGDDVLICRDDMLSRRHGAHHVVLCRRPSAHDLDDDGDLRIVQDFFKIIR